MINFPTRLRTTADFDLAHSLALKGSQADKDAMVEAWNGLLNSAYGYVFDKNLSATASPTGPFPAYIVLTQQDGTRRQEKRVRLANAPIDVLGYTEAQVQTFVTDLGGTPL